MQMRRFKVLLVEDSEEDYQVIRDLLSGIRARADLTWVTDYFDALDVMGSHDFDLYLIDYHLGEHSGLDLLREAIDLGCKTPGILLLNENDYNVDTQAMRNGAADYLVKGYTGPQLLERSMRYAVERAEMLEALKELAIRDELTGLYNRREAMRILSEEVERSLRYKCSLSVVLLRVDQFAQINQTYGHQAGDAVLQWVAQVMRDSIRGTDRAARYGHEEMAVLLPETNPLGAAVVAERICAGVRSRLVTAADQRRNPVEIPVTISAGIAGVPEDAISDIGLVAAASQALESVHHLGRNGIVLYNTIEQIAAG